MSGTPRDGETWGEYRDRELARIRDELAGIEAVIARDPIARWVYRGIRAWYRVKAIVAGRGAGMSDSFLVLLVIWAVVVLVIVVYVEFPR